MKSEAKYWGTVLHFTAIAMGAVAGVVYLWANNGSGIPGNDVVRVGFTGYLIGAVIAMFPWELIRR